eukprot:6378662-Pyramimonas_sp.AAC.2
MSLRTPPPVRALRRNKDARGVRERTLEGSTNGTLEGSGRLTSPTSPMCHQGRRRRCAPARTLEGSESRR